MAGIDFNLTEFALELIKQYGASGVLVLAVFYYIRVTGQKLDKILRLNNRIFGVSVSMLDGKDRKKYTDTNSIPRGDE